MAVKPRKISEIKPLFTNLAQTSHYEVQFGTLSPNLLLYLGKKGVDVGFITQSAGLLCYSASLPTTSLANFTIDGNYMGIRENFAHSRQYNEISLDFYVDNNYKMIKFLECWMEFIASGSHHRVIEPLPNQNLPVSQNSKNYFMRMQYPEYYKVDQVKIIKFDRNYQQEIEYTFRGFYPQSMSSMPVSYVNSDTLKVSASFSYDRYIAGKTSRFAELLTGDNNNNDPTQEPKLESPLSREDIFRQSQPSFQFGVSNNQDINSVGNSLSSNPLGSTNDITLF